MKPKFTVIAGTSHKVIEDENKLNGMADWFYTHYSHKVEDPELVEQIHKKAKGRSSFEENDLIYLIRNE